MLLGFQPYFNVVHVYANRDKRCLYTRKNIIAVETISTCRNVQATLVCSSQHKKNDGSEGRKSRWAKNA